MPSSQRNMQILQKKRTFPQGMHEEKCKRDIHLRPDDCAEFAVNTFTYKEGRSSDTEATRVIVGSVSAENTSHSLDRHQNRIHLPERSAE